MNIFKWLNQLCCTLIPKRVYALIGEAGTGKSFRAFPLAEKYNIHFIIDDGLLIKDKHIIAGRSSKQEKYLATAVKTAIFYDEALAQDVRQKLNQFHYRKILVIATSEKMLEIISERLALPHPDEIIPIEQIATNDEIQLARINRIKYGAHVVPLSLEEAQKEHANIILHTLQMIIEKPRGLFFKKKRSELVEKTIVKPDYSQAGKVIVTEKAIQELVCYAMNQFTKLVQVIKVHMKYHDRGYSLFLKMSIKDKSGDSEFIEKIREKVKVKMNEYTGFAIHNVEIEIET